MLSLKLLRLFVHALILVCSFVLSSSLWSQTVVINEIMPNPAAVTDANGEWFEIFNPTASAIDINGWTIKDNDTDSHTITNGGPLLVPAGGFLVLALNGDSGTNGGVTVDYVYSGITLANGDDEVVLLDDLSNEIDRVEYDGGPNFPDPTGASMALSHPLLDNNLGSNWCTASAPFGNGDFGTPGVVNDCVLEQEIFEIQGSGLASPFDGFIVTTTDNVVTAVGPDGFFMQTPAARTDGDSDTSDGIFVFTNTPPTVSVGDNVDVTGRVQEFFDFTEFDDDELIITVNSSGNPVAAAVAFDATTPSPDPNTPSCSVNNFECFEGMLVEIADGTVTGPNQSFSGDTIAEVHIVANSMRAFRETGIEFPGLPSLPVWDSNPEVFEMDPDKLGLLNQTIPAGSGFQATGVLGFEFGGYELWPKSLTVDPVTLPQPVRAREAGEFTIGSLNLFRLFDDVNDPANQDAQGGSRDDGTPVSTAEYDRRLAKFVKYILEVLLAPDILAVQEAEKIEVLQALAADITAVDPSVVYTAFLEEGNDVGTIDIGFLVRQSVQVDAITQLGATETFVDPTDSSVDLVHDRPPLLLEGSFLAGTGPFPISVMGIHMRSLSGIAGSDSLRIRQKRLEQAQSIAQKVQDQQTADPSVRLLVVGDFNAFEFTDGYVDVVGQIRGDLNPGDNLLSGADLVNPNLTNQVLTLDSKQRYSFIFRGSAQVLDHALTSQALTSAVTGFAYGRGNADAAVDLINDDSTALRSSDHDGLVLFVQTPLLPHEFLFLAEEFVESKKHKLLEGNIHSNNDIEIKKGKKSDLVGNLTAVDDIDIGKKNDVDGDVTAGGDVDNDGDVTGSVTQYTSVSAIALPTIAPFSVGTDAIEVDKKETLPLAPDSYGNVKVEKGGTLELTSGEYFMKSLELSKKAKLCIEITGGLPVVINLSDDLVFGKSSEVIIKPNGEADSDLVTFNFADDDDNKGKDDFVEIGKKAKVLGTIIAPDAWVVLQSKSRFKGAICAENIVVKSKVVALHHSVATSLPKAAPDGDADADADEVLITSMPTEFELGQNYPNPFNPSTTISFALPHAGEVSLKIYNLRGQLVATLHQGAMAAGRHQIVWSGRDQRGLQVASGIYVYRLETDKFVATKKLTLMK